MNPLPASRAEGSLFYSLVERALASHRSSGEDSLRIPLVLLCRSRLRTWAAACSRPCPPSFPRRPRHQEPAESVLHPDRDGREARTSAPVAGLCNMDAREQVGGGHGPVALTVTPPGGRTVIAGTEAMGSRIISWGTPKMAPTPSDRSLGSRATPSNQHNAHEHHGNRERIDVHRRDNLDLLTRRGIMTGGGEGPDAGRPVRKYLRGSASEVR